MKETGRLSDITACEAFIYEVLADSPHLLRCHDKSGAAVFFNHSWLEFRGRTLEDELGWGWLEGIREDDRDRLKKELESSFARASTATLAIASGLTGAKVCPGTWPPVLTCRILSPKRRG